MKSIEIVRFSDLNQSINHIVLNCGLKSSELFYMPLKMVELFSGAGLLGHAFSQLGFEPVLAVDSDCDAVSSYNQNNKTSIAKIHDVRNPISVDADIIVAGPPCQGFSSLGKRDEKDVRNQLSLEIIKWADSSKAKVVVVENVPPFLKSIHKNQLKESLSHLGFDHAQWILNASDYGTPQNRVRSFSIFSKNGLPTKPEPDATKISIAEAFVNAGLKLHHWPE